MEGLLVLRKKKRGPQKRKLNVFGSQGPCATPPVIGMLARMLGLRCQEVFELAYADPAIGRARFLDFLDRPTAENMPEPVHAFCANHADDTPNESVSKRSCMGCQVRCDVQDALRDLYAEFIAPVRT